MHLRRRKPEWLLVCGQVFLRYGDTEGEAFIWCACDDRDEAFCLSHMSEGAIYLARLALWGAGFIATRPRPARLADVIAVRMLRNITTVFE